MALVTNKLDKTGLSHVWGKIVENFLAKGEAELNVIENVKVNGVALEVTEKAVNILVPTGALASIDTVDEEHLAESLRQLITGKADKSTTLAGYGITDAYTREDTDSAISAAVGQAVAGIYRVKGSVVLSALPTEGMEEGDVYNISEDFTTTDKFVEGVGKEYPAGTNVVYTENGWDCLAGIYDFSEFLLISDLVDITKEEIDEICVMPQA